MDARNRERSAGREKSRVRISDMSSSRVPPPPPKIDHVQLLPPSAMSPHHGLTCHLLIGFNADSLHPRYAPFGDTESQLFRLCGFITKITTTKYPHLSLQLSQVSQLEVGITEPKECGDASGQVCGLDLVERNFSPSLPSSLPPSCSLLEMREANRHVLFLFFFRQRCDGV